MAENDKIRPPSRTASGVQSKIKGSRAVDVSSVGDDLLHLGRAQLLFQLGECLFQAVRECNPAAESDRLLRFAFQRYAHPSRVPLRTALCLLLRSPSGPPLPQIS